MPLSVIQADITQVKADAVVNPANTRPAIGSGIESAIYEAAGEEKLLAARMLIGEIRPGRAVETSAYNLGAGHIIHTVCPEWCGGHLGEMDTLADCYANSLNLAAELKCASVAFPLLGTGSCGFPYDTAIGIARCMIQRFLSETDIDIDVYIAVPEQVPGRLAAGIREYIDDNLIINAEFDENGLTEDDLHEMAAIKNHRDNGYRRFHNSPIDMNDSIYTGVDEDNDEASFAVKVFEYADRLNITDTELCGGRHELFFPRKYLSDMRRDTDYHPPKDVCIIISQVLKLGLTETLDLLERAGYTLSRARRKDVVVRACIVNGVHDVFAISTYQRDTYQRDGSQ